jgi:hypothetical protein
MDLNPNANSNTEEAKKYDTKIKYTLVSSGISSIVSMIIFLIVGFYASSQVSGIVIGSGPLILTIIISILLYMNPVILLVLAFGGIYYIPILISLFLSSSIAMSFVY